MLTKEENAKLCHVGPGTIMGDLMRQYWTPALLSSELPEPDCAPVRVKLLGEELIAFRDSAGRVGLLGDHCPHRGASLFFGRNEEAGLRCVYHGWKFDATGRCVDMPNEPAESSFKDKVRAQAYPCQERAGIVWTYMGPRSTPPSLPDLEPNMLPDDEWTVTAAMRECNYFQALEGDIDTSHASFLHWGSVRPTNVRPGTFMYYRVQDRAPSYKVVDTSFGTMYGAYRPAEEDSDYWRIAAYLFPFYVIIPTGLLGHQVLVRAWVPMDDTHTMYISMGRRNERATRDRAGAERTNGMPYAPTTTDWYGRFRLRPNASNDYFIDRDQQRQKVTYTGIDGVHVQDQAVTESEGAIYDRSAEHLVSSDSMIIRTRHRLLGVAQALRDQGTVPPGVDDPEVFRVRAGGIILPKGADWLAETEQLRKAFVNHPDLDPAIVG
jgi:phenylpropionate dioxygenase-like ring-hydroxylating dioxygenase large terminal subunit